MKRAQDLFQKALGLIRAGGEMSWILAAVFLFAALAVFSVKDIEPGRFPPCSAA